ncbi:universal stress protein [Humibacillus xanthopallidus]|uniref:Nucleotide-binding universal stress UspA family protein n=1 Tax=Humibacillus xanthopallidus TaxID=412689 RepID=A0A543HZB9_9MICO|nr:universal stress protein [Humibacillus xanthopallidus]TQM63683.1 nucleotide-binding universal stress UspA family protein [Humibacillus xanthopallidus]
MADPSGVPNRTALSEAEDEEGVGAIGSVVVGIDGSEADGPVTDWAADEAHRLGAPLRLVHAIDPGGQMTSYDMLASGAPSLAERLSQGAHQLLDASSARAHARHPSLDIAGIAPTGRAAAALVGLSDGALRMVVGAPARRHLERILLGSVALPVVAHAHCPVVVVPTGTTVATPQRLVVGVDGSHGSGRAIDFALRTAESCGAAVACVLVWNIEVEEGVVVTEPESEHWSAVERRYLEVGHEVVDPVVASHPDVEVSITVRHGSTAEELIHAVADLDADLLVVGSRGRGGFRGLLLGSVSRRVIEQARGVVAVVR